MQRTATAHWEGDLKTGKGLLNSPSQILHDTQYSFKTRFEDGNGTNPEELLAAAHAGCFTMAVSSILGQDGFTPTRLDTTATVSMEGLTITGSHLKITGSIPGITAEKFAEVVKTAEQNCVISKALSIKISSESTLV
jgi:lipoyl-dependent peroxiredoxin